MEQKFKISDRVCYVEYIIKGEWPMGDIVNTIEHYGYIIDICGLHSDIAIPQALVAFDNYGTKFIPLDDLRKIEE